MTTVIEKPMLFSATMVRAILEGRKTQTRRIVKPQPDCEVQDLPYWSIGGWRLRDDAPNPVKCPHPVGSRMWVRESYWQVDAPGCGDLPCILYDEEIELYQNLEWTYSRSEEFWDSRIHWSSKRFGRIPSIHMPRWASRITLEVTDVRVQRLQEIDGMDAKAEGASIPAHIPHDGADMDWARREFKALWNSINGPDAWEQNPWVWAYTFRRLEGDHD